MPPDVISSPRSGHKYFFVVSFSTGFARAVHSFSTVEPWTEVFEALFRERRGAESTMMAFRPMRARLLSLAALVIWACAVSAQAATDATLFRLFLRDGSTLVSFGEYTRVEDRVVFSMPVGGSPDDPRLQVVWIPAASVDWPRTDRYAASARFHRATMA